MTSTSPYSQLRDKDGLALLHRTGMAPWTPSAITSVEAVLAELERVRERGYAVDDGQQRSGGPLRRSARAEGAHAGGHPRVRPSCRVAVERLQTIW